MTTETEHQRSIFLLVYPLLLVAGLLFPFDHHIPGYASYRNAEGYGVEFTARDDGVSWTGLISPLGSSLAIAKLASQEGWTMSVRIRTGKSVGSLPARIVSYSGGLSDARNFTLGEYKARLYFVSRTVPATFISVPGVLDRETEYSVRVSVGKMGARIWLDDDLVAESLEPRLFTGWNPGYRLVVGNEVTGTVPWSGGISELTVNVGEIADDREDHSSLILHFDFGTADAASSGRLYWNDLALVPLSPWSTRDQILSLSSARFSLFDALLNVLIFIPIGLLHNRIGIGGKSRLSGRIVVLILGASISVSCELLQHLSAVRISTGIDFLANLAGTALGTAVRLDWLARRRE